MTELKIGILETGRPPEELSPKYGSYPNMIANWLSHLDGEISTYRVLDGEFPQSVTQCDLWVITGSKFGCYEDHDWIKPLEEFIRNAKTAGKLMFGICFGHQVIAQALGGEVQKFAKGWALGIHQYSTQNWPDELGNAPDKINLQAYHQDQIITLPKGAEPIASSKFCKFAAVYYPDFGFTVQGHPEFSDAYAHDLLEFRRDNGLTSAQVDLGQANMLHNSNRDVIANIIENYLQHKG